MSPANSKSGPAGVHIRAASKRNAVTIIPAVFPFMSDAFVAAHKHTFLTKDCRCVDKVPFHAVYPKCGHTT